MRPPSGFCANAAARARFVVCILLNERNRRTIITPIHATPPFNCRRLLTRAPTPAHAEIGSVHFNTSADGFNAGTFFEGDEHITLSREGDRATAHASHGHGHDRGHDDRPRTPKHKGRRKR